MKKLKIKDVINEEAIFTRDTHEYYGKDINGIFDSEAYLSEFNTYFSGLGIDVEDDLYKTFRDKIYFNSNNALDYYIAHSNEKIISPFYNKLYERWNGTINRYSIYDKLFSQILDEYAFAWYKKFCALMTNYKPLENYNLDELRTPDITETDDYSSTDESSLKKHVEISTGTDTSGTTGIYAFNQPGTTSTPTADTVGEQDVKVEADGEKNKDVFYDEKTNGGTRTTTGTESLKRSGNIGVTTSQQMLEAELKLRDYNFMESMFEDIDKILCLSIY